MSTRVAYRSDLNDKLLALEDGGYGDFEYTDAQFDTFLDLSCVRMWPAVYKRVSVTVPGTGLTQYGTGGLGYLTNQQGTVTIPTDRVFAIDDAYEFDPIVGWGVRPDRIVNLDYYNTSTYGVIVYYYDAYSMPVGDALDAGIPAIYDGLINLGALIEAVEARQDTGVRGEPQPTGQFAEVSLLDRLTPRYERLRAELALSLPAMVF